MPFFSFDSTVDLNTDGRTDVTDINVDGIDSTAPGEFVAPSTYQKAENVFLSKNSSLRALIVLSMGLTSVDSVDLIDLEVDPPKSLGMGA